MCVGGKHDVFFLMNTVMQVIHCKHID